MTSKYRRVHDNITSVKTWYSEHHIGPCQKLNSRLNSFSQNDGSNINQPAIGQCLILCVIYMESNTASLVRNLRNWNSFLHLIDKCYLSKFPTDYSNQNMTQTKYSFKKKLQKVTKQLTYY